MLLCSYLNSAISELDNIGGSTIAIYNPKVKNRVSIMRIK